MLEAFPSLASLQIACIFTEGMRIGLTLDKGPMPMISAVRVWYGEKPASVSGPREYTFRQ
jgi:hypothetical protein